MVWLQEFLLHLKVPEPDSSERSAIWFELFGKLLALGFFIIVFAVQNEEGLVFKVAFLAIIISMAWNYAFLQVYHNFWKRNKQEFAQEQDAVGRYVATCLLKVPIGVGLASLPFLCLSIKYFQRPSGGLELWWHRLTDGRYGEEEHFLVECIVPLLVWGGCLKMRFKAVPNAALIEQNLNLLAAKELWPLTFWMVFTHSLDSVLFWYIYFVLGYLGVFSFFPPEPIVFLGKIFPVWAIICTYALSSFVLVGIYEKIVREKHLAGRGERRRD